MFQSAEDYPDPPALWGSLPLNWPNDHLDRQWAHYRPLFLKYGFSLRDFESESLPVPEHPSLPAPQDVFSPQANELFAPVPLKPGPRAVLLRHYHVRVGHDVLNREVYFKALFGAERDVVLYLARQQEIARDPRDHTIPILRIIETSSCAFAITPKWGWISVPFYALGEPIEFLRQCAEGLTYLHEHRISHGDLSVTNIVMSFDGEDSYHPDCLEPFRSLFDARYAYIDFGLSRQFNRSMSLRDATATGASGTDPFRAPELSTTSAYNPFSADIYSLGSLVLDQLHGSELSHSPVLTLLHERTPTFVTLLKSMMETDPSKRPLAEKVLTEVTSIQESAGPQVLSLSMTQAAQTQHNGATGMSRPAHRALAGARNRSINIKQCICQ